LKTIIQLYMLTFLVRFLPAQQAWTAPDFSRWLDYQEKMTEADESQFFSHPASSSYIAPDKTISAARLRHIPPPRAAHAFSRGLQLAMENHPEKSAAEFRKALEIDPDFSEAHGDLAVQYIDLGLLDAAAGELHKAIALDRSTSAHHANLSLVLMLLHQLPEAETEARTAVSLDPTNPKPHYLLGCILTRNPQTVSSAVEHLNIAAEQFPEAHAALAELYRVTGDETLAVAEAERYRQAQSVTVRKHNGGKKSPNS
jgi:Flp pilus assembly protein TadD